MQATAHLYLKFIPFPDFNLWDVKTYTSKKLKSKFPLIKLNQILSVDKMEWVEIENDKFYPILGVRANGKGVYLNRNAKGSELTMKKYQKSKVNYLFYCKVRTVNGQWGVVYPEYENTYGSSNMQYLKIDETKINFRFFELLLSLKSLTDEFDKNAIGADGRHFTLKTLLSLEIPLPSMNEQIELVDNYQNKTNEADSLTQQASDLEGEIEKYFLEQLGLKPFSIKEKVFTLQTTDYVLLDRWDFFSTDTRIAIELKKSKFKLSSIGQSFHFAKRSFNKAQYKKETFKYIEIGAIDSTKGILEAKEIELKNAPSRATQIIKEGDLILGTTRPYLKKFAIVPNDYDNDVCSSGFCVIEPSEEYHLPYLHQFLKCTYGIEQLKNRMTGGLYPAITEPELKEIKIPFPDIEIQKEIMTLIELKKENILKNKDLIFSIREKAEQEFENAIFR